MPGLSKVAQVVKKATANPRTGFLRGSLDDMIALVAEEMKRAKATAPTADQLNSLRSLAKTPAERKQVESIFQLEKGLSRSAGPGAMPGQMEMVFDNQPRSVTGMSSRLPGMEDGGFPDRNLNDSNFGFNTTPQASHAPTLQQPQLAGLGEVSPVRKPMNPNLKKGLVGAGAVGGLGALYAGLMPTVGGDPNYKQPMPSHTPAPSQTPMQTQHFDVGDNFGFNPSYEDEPSAMLKAVNKGATGKRGVKSKQSGLTGINGAPAPKIDFNAPDVNFEDMFRKDFERPIQQASVEKKENGWMTALKTMGPILAALMAGKMMK